MSYRSAKPSPCFQVRDTYIAFGLVTGTYLFIGVVFYITFPLPKSCIEDVSSGINLMKRFGRKLRTCKLIWVKYHFCRLVRASQIKNLVDFLKIK
jgi:hypothetical protein